MSDLWEKLVQGWMTEGREEERKLTAEKRINQIVNAIRHAVTRHRPIDDVCAYLDCSLDEVLELAKANGIAIDN